MQTTRWEEREEASTYVFEILSGRGRLSERASKGGREGRRL